MRKSVSSGRFCFICPNLISYSDRFADIQAESIAASKKIAALELKWNELKNLDECEELFNVFLRLSL